MTLAATRVLALTLVCAAVAGLGAHSRPNVALIVIDTLRADHLGCYGYERDTSPRLDALARSGVRFANAYATSSWTGASVASIMTGLYPAVHGLETGTSVLASGLTTLAEEFRSAGYSTAAFSANPLFVVPEMGLAQGFERFDVLHGPPADYSKNIDAVPTEVGGQTMVQVAKADLLTDRALAWVTEPGRGRRPFFLYVHYFDPHGGYFPPHEYAARFGVAPDAPLAGAAQ